MIVFCQECGDLLLLNIHQIVDKKIIDCKCEAQYVLSDEVKLVKVN